MLTTVIVAAGALDVATASHGHHHLLFGDEVLDAHVSVESKHDLGAAVIPVLGDQFGEFLADDVALALRARDDGHEFHDLQLDGIVLVDDLLALQRGEAAKLHLENRARLDLVDVEQIDQTVAGVFDSG